MYPNRWWDILACWRISTSTSILTKLCRSNKSYPYIPQTYTHTHRCITTYVHTYICMFAHSVLKRVNFPIFYLFPRFVVHTCVVVSFIFGWLRASKLICKESKNGKWKVSFACNSNTYIPLYAWQCVRPVIYWLTSLLLHNCHCKTLPLWNTEFSLFTQFMLLLIKRKVWWKPLWNNDFANLWAFEWDNLLSVSPKSIPSGLPISRLGDNSCSHRA